MTLHDLKGVRLSPFAWAYMGVACWAGAQHLGFYIAWVAFFDLAFGIWKTGRFKLKQFPGQNEYRAAVEALRVMVVSAATAALSWDMGLNFGDKIPDALVSAAAMIGLASTIPMVGLIRIRKPGEFRDSVQPRFKHDRLWPWLLGVPQLAIVANLHLIVTPQSAADVRTYAFCASAVLIAGTLVMLRFMAPSGPTPASRA